MPGKGLEGTRQSSTINPADKPSMHEDELEDSVGELSWALNMTVWESLLGDTWR